MTSEPTHNDAAEREILGTLLQEPAFYEAAYGLSPNDFGVSHHKTVWRAVNRLVSDGRSITPQAVRALSGTEVPADLLERLMSDATRDEALFKAAVDNVRDASSRRYVSKLLLDTRREVETSKDPLQLIVSRSAAAIDRAAAGNSNPLFSGREASQKLREQHKNPLPRLRTGLAKFDHVLGGGLPPRRMIAVVAKTKTGKSTLCATCSYNLSEQEVPHAVISLERSSTDLQALSTARAIQTTAARIERSFDDYEKQIIAYENSGRADFCSYYHKPGATIDEIRQVVVTARRTRGIRALFLDYLQLIRSTGPGNRTEKLTEAAQILADLTNDLDIATVVFSQSDDEGRARECKALHHAAAANFTLRREEDSHDAWMENMGSNFLDNMSVGGPGDPGLRLVTDIGPHFVSA